MTQTPLSLVEFAARRRDPFPLIPVLSPSGPISADIDAIFRTLARRVSTGDRAACNALYFAFAPRLDHWIRRAESACKRLGFDPAIEPEDIQQEAFVVFADLVESWDGRGSMSGYVIAYFPWRLSNAVRRMSDPRQRRSPSANTADSLNDGSFGGDEAIALLTTIAESLPEREGRILLLRIRDGLTWDQIAERIGVDKRTALRHWRGIVLNLRVAMKRVR